MIIIISFSSNSPQRNHVIKEEISSYSEQHLFSNGCLRNGTFD